MKRISLIIALLIGTPILGQAKGLINGLFHQPVTSAGILPLAELTASDGGGYDSLGTSVAVSGNTVVVGAPTGHSTQHGQEGPGFAYVFTKPASGWGDMTQTAELSASDGKTGDLFGYSVSVFGNVIVVGAPVSPANNGDGAVYLFVKPAGGWKSMTETVKLTASDGQPNFQFGFSVGISGNTVVAGAPGFELHNYPGAAYVFTQATTDWSTVHETAKLTAADGQPGAQFGYSVTFSGDSIAVGAVGDPGMLSNSGSAYIFVKPAGGWVNNTETAKLIASDDGKWFGYSIHMSSDSSTIVVGAIYANNFAGAAYIFVKPVGGWVNGTETAKLSPSDSNSRDFGYSVGTNGNLVLVGSPLNGNGGEVYGFLKPSKGWGNTSTSTFEVLNPDSSGGYFGYSLNLNDNIAIIGASYDGGGNGAAFVYGKQN